jgi:hypothetical protein
MSGYLRLSYPRVIVGPNCSTLISGFGELSTFLKQTDLPKQGQIVNKRRQSNTISFGSCNIFKPSKGAIRMLIPAENHTKNTSQHTLIPFNMPFDKQQARATMVSSRIFFYIQPLISMRNEKIDMAWVLCL